MWGIWCGFHKDKDCHGGYCEAPFVHHLHFICGLQCMCLLPFVWYSKLSRSDNKLHVMNSNSWSLNSWRVCIFDWLAFAACSPFNPWAVWILAFHPTAVHAGERQSFTPPPSPPLSAPYPAAHRWRSATRPIPHRSVFPIESCEVCSFLSCHSSRSLPPDRMALELRTWNCPP